MFNIIYLIVFIQFSQTLKRCFRFLIKHICLKLFMRISTYFLHVLTEADVQVDSNKASAQTIYNIKVLAPASYANKYEETHESLGSDLQKIKEKVQNELNRSVRFRENGISIQINLESPTSHPVMDELDDSICEGSLTSITSLLDKINVVDASSHYIVLLPCLPNNYTNIFLSAHIDVPIVQHKINAQCSNRLAIFQEREYKYLLASFGNAILKTLGAPLEDYSKLTTTSSGDNGLESNITISESSVHDILNSKCFFNILSL